MADWGTSGRACRLVGRRLHNHGDRQHRRTAPSNAVEALCLDECLHVGSRSSETRLTDEQHDALCQPSPILMRHRVPVRNLHDRRGEVDVEDAPDKDEVE